MRSFFIVPVLAYVGLMLMLFFRQNSLVYYPDIPSRKPTATPSDISLTYEEVTFRADDGVRLHGWFVPAAAEHGVVLFFHGNAGNISHRLDSLAIFHRLGWSTFIFDYRGYGNSEGKPGEQGTYRDADAAWHYLVEQRGVPAERVVLFGRSLGASIAAYLANTVRPRALIVESAFTSVPDLGADLYPYLPVRWLARLKYDTASYLSAVNMPVLVIHSRDDEIIPFQHGQRLYSLAKSPKSWLELSGGHNDGFIVSGERYVEGLREFLESLGES